MQKVLASSNGTGLNAQTGEYVDLFKAGVVDPLKVTRTALENAVSGRAPCLDRGENADYTGIG